MGPYSVFHVPLPSSCQPVRVTAMVRLPSNQWIGSSNAASVATTARTISIVPTVRPDVMADRIRPPLATHLQDAVDINVRVKVWSKLRPDRTRTVVPNARHCYRVYRIMRF